MNDKTNVARILDNLGVSYLTHTYDASAENGVEVARLVGLDCNKVFKTLVTVGKSGKFYVFAIPVCGELDLKKAAKAAGEKSIDMLKQKDLLATTGYIHGGCSPIGMKKKFPTFFHNSLGGLDTVVFSAGKKGFQVELAVGDLYKALNYRLADLVAQR